MSKKTVLIIDDSGIMLRNMRRWMGEKYQVIMANSGKVGIKYLTEYTADLVLLDLMMPEMDGFETFRRIRLLENGASVPIIFLTGVEDAEKELTALEMGAADFVRKPVHPAVMLNRIDRVISLEEYNRDTEAVIRTQREQLETLTLEAITAIAKTIDAKDAYTRGHSERVAAYAVRIGEGYGLSEKELEELHTLGLLHDIGKIGIADRILFKNSRLDEEEYAVMKTHSTIGGEILKTIKSIPHLSDGARYHHERYDGKGYPEGLSGEDIPLSARMIAVADAFDAMTSNRVYRASLDMDHVVSEIENGKGTQFDPELAEILLGLLRKDKDFVIKQEN